MPKTDSYTPQELQSLPSLSGSRNQSAFGKSIPLILGKTYFTPYVLGKPYTTVTGIDGCDQTYHALYLIGYHNLKIEDVSIGNEVLAENKTNPVDNGALTITSTKYPVATSQTQLELQQGANEVSIYSQKVVQENFSAELMNVAGNPLDVYAFSARHPQYIELEIGFKGLISYQNNGAPFWAGCVIKVEYSLDGGATWLVDDVNPWDMTLSTNQGAYVPETHCMHFINMQNKEMRYVYKKTVTPQMMNNCNSKVIQFRITRQNVQSTLTNVCDKAYFTAIRTWCYDPLKSTDQTLVPQTPMNEKERNKTARLGFSIKTSEDLQNTFDKISCIATAKARTFDGTGWSKSLSPTRNPASMALMVLTGDYKDPMYRYNLTEGVTYMESNKLDLDSFGVLYQYCNETKQFGKIFDNRHYCDGAVLNGQKTIDLVNAILQTAKSFLILKGKKYGIFIDKPIENPILILNNNNLLDLTLTKSFGGLVDGQNVKYVSALNYYQQDTIAVKPVESPPVSSTDVLENIEFPYISDPYHAKALSLYKQACKKLRPETLSAKVTSEGALAEVGSLITIQSPIISVGIGEGAEVVELILDENDNTKITGVVVDAPFTVADVGNSYGIQIDTVTDLGELKTRRIKLSVFTRTGDYNRLMFLVPEDVETSNIEVGAIISFGIYGTETMDVLCLGKKENGDGTYELTLLPYDEQVYNADSQIVIDFDPKITTAEQSGLPLNLGDNTLSQADILASTSPFISAVNTRIDSLENGTETISAPNDVTGLRAIAEETGIEISWNPFTANGMNNIIKRFHIEISKDNGQTWTSISYVNGTNNAKYTFVRTGAGADGYPEAEDLEPYFVRVKAENVYGQLSANWTTENVDTTSYGTWIPQQPIIATPRINHRTVTMNFSQRNNCYGGVVYLVSIQRYDEYEEDVDTWFKPDLNTDPYGSSTSYKDTDATEYFVKDGKSYFYLKSANSFTQTLPLQKQLAEQTLQVHLGGGVIETLNAKRHATSQEVQIEVVSESDKTQAIDTNYYYRIWCLNVTTGAVSEMFSQMLITAKATSAYDIVDSAIITNKLAEGAVTVDKLHANSITAEKLATRNLTAFGAFIGSIYGAQIDESKCLPATVWQGGVTYYVFNEVTGDYELPVIQPTQENFDECEYYTLNQNYNKPIGKVNNYWKDLDCANNSKPEFRIGNDIDAEMFEIKRKYWETEAEYIHYVPENKRYPYTYVDPRTGIEETDYADLEAGLYFKIANFVVTAISSLIKGVFYVMNKLSTRSFLSVNPETTATSDTHINAETMLVNGDVEIGSKAGGSAGKVKCASGVTLAGGVKVENSVGTKVGEIDTSGNIKGYSVNVDTSVSAGSLSANSASITGALSAGGVGTFGNLTSNNDVTATTNLNGKYLNLRYGSRISGFVFDANTATLTIRTDD